MPAGAAAPLLLPPTDSPWPDEAADYLRPDCRMANAAATWTDDLQYGCEISLDLAPWRPCGCGETCLSRTRSASSPRAPAAGTAGPPALRLGWVCLPRVAASSARGRPTWSSWPRATPRPTRSMSALAAFRGPAGTDGSAAGYGVDAAPPTTALACRGRRAAREVMVHWPMPATCAKDRLACLVQSGSNRPRTRRVPSG